MSSALPLNPHLPSNVLYGDTFRERDTLLGPSVSKHGGGSGFISQEHCRSRALLGLWGCKKETAPTEASLPMPLALIHLTNTNKQSTLEEISSGGINGYKNSTEDSLAIFIDIVNASTFRFSNSIFRIRYTCICLKWRMSKVFNATLLMKAKDWKQHK